MKVSRKPRLSDVARRAGVSTTTASYILNGRSVQMRISQDAQDRVRRAAAELNYRPNPNARNLRNATTRTVGVISDLVAGGQFASEMLTGASAAARSLDHLILVGEHQGDRHLESLLIEEMLDRRVDGIVYARVATSEVAVPEVLRQHNAVLLNCVDRTTSLPAVLPDEYEGGRTAAAALLAGAPDGEVYVVGEMPTPGSLAGGLRIDGIRDGLRAAGVRLAGLVPCPWSTPDAYEAVDAVLGQGTRPGGLVCLNDRIGLGVYKALADHGLRVGEDVSVVSFDGSDLAGWLRPRLTSVVLPHETLGARAIELLLDGAGRGPAVVRVPMPVAAGESVRRTAETRDDGARRPSLG
jgi:LacI family transcriptional regulator